MRWSSGGTRGQPPAGQDFGRVEVSYGSGLRNRTLFATMMSPAPDASGPMAHPTDDVKNWMNMFRWIVKLIRDDYEVDEALLVRTAVLETDCGLVIEQVEVVLGIISESFAISFPPETLDEVLKLGAQTMYTCWQAG